MSVAPQPKEFRERHIAFLSGPEGRQEPATVRFVIRDRNCNSSGTANSNTEVDFKFGLFSDVFDNVITLCSIIGFKTLGRREAMVEQRQRTGPSFLMTAEAEAQ